MSAPPPGAGPPDEGPRPLRPGEVLRLVLPAFVVSTALAVAGIVLVLLGHDVVGLVLVAVAAVGGLFYRARVVWRAQQRPPDRP